MSDVDALPGTKRSLKGTSRPNYARIALETCVREPGWAEPELVDGAYFGSSLSLQFFCPVIQFVCVESLVTALVDLYPRVLRKKNRREVLILGVSVISFLVGLVMVTEVRLWEA